MTLQLGVFAQKQEYSAPNLKTVIKTHKIVAILPFKVAISYKKMPKNLDAQSIKDEEVRESVSMQEGMYTYLLRKAKSFSVEFQDVEQTNRLLKKSNVYDKIEELPMDTLCKVLGVDAIIRSSWNYEKTGSEVGAIAKTLLFGFGSSASGNLLMQIYDAKKGDLLWRFYKEMSESAFSTGNELMERMMKKVARNFPYEK